MSLLIKCDCGTPGCDCRLRVQKFGEKQLVLSIVSNNERNIFLSKEDVNRLIKELNDKMLL